MIRTAHRWILCVLMLLLPLQGFAAGMMSCGSMRAPDGIGQPTAEQHAAHHGDHQGNTSNQDDGAATDENSPRCGACAMCNMCASMMVSSAAGACQRSTGMEHSTTPSACKAFIPESPQPPPQLR